MPAFVVPARSGAHRVAAIALYRALLTQCSPAARPPLPLADDQRDALRNVIRNTFRRNRHVHSTRLLKLSFTAGYELLDTLDRVSSTTTTTTAAAAAAAAAAASETEAKASATALLHALLPTLPAHLARAPGSLRRRRHHPDPCPEACPPPARAELAVRPRPARALGGTGVRRVPRLVSANLFPMLRLRKPQPRSLSRVLTDRVKQRQRRLDVRADAADNWTALARREDEWDRLCWVRMGVPPGPPPPDGARGGVEDGLGEDAVGEEGESGDDGWDWDESLEGSWTDEPQRVVRIISAQLGAQRKKVVETVKRMQEVVDKERAMAAVEREERKRRREVARKASGRETVLGEVLGEALEDVFRGKGGSGKGGRSRGARGKGGKPI